MLNEYRLSKTNSRKCIAEINVVPYVDVMLVLLIIFMVTAPLINQGVKIDLPQAQAKEINTEDSLPIFVSVNEEGGMFLNISSQPQDSLEPRALMVEVAAAITREPNRMVVVRGDKKTSYDDVVQAMVILQKAGVENISLETNPYAG